MKKILSIALALCMILSMSTTVLADVGYFTKIRLEGNRENYWELDVPASMTPGETKEVALYGTWDSLMVLNVSTDDEVFMGNDIDDTVISLDVDFDTISQKGSVVDVLNITRDITVASMDSFYYFGTWEGILNYYLTIEHSNEVKEFTKDADGNILISSAEDLIYLSDYIASHYNYNDANTNREMSVILTNNIDMKNIPFKPIGSTKSVMPYGTTSFNGTFDGQGFTISNLNISATDHETNEASSAALFAAGGINGYPTIIKNLKIDGAKVSGTHFAATLVGTAGDYLEVIDCEVKDATITSTYYNEENSGDKAGVFVGTASGNAKLTNCVAIDSTVTASRDAGQIAGAARESALVNCSTTNVEVIWNGLGTGANIRNELIGRLLN